MNKYARTLEELTQFAVRYWPTVVTDKEDGLSILPRLFATQSKFISVLTLADKTPDAWKNLVDVSEDMPANLFLKHLMVLSDFGGEALQKITPFDNHFPDGRMQYLWREGDYEYVFRALTNGRRASNKCLRVDGCCFDKGYCLTPVMEDVIMFLLHGATSAGDDLTVALKSKCTVGDYMGKPDELAAFVRQSYIRVSRQLAGAANNALGQITQDIVVQYLSEDLPGWEVKRNGSIPGISINQGRTNAAFDVVTRSPGGIYFGVEVSFQFTGNSVIERKARDAQGLQQRLAESGHHICYVIDGAGNIDVRRSAVATICQFSDCTVAFSETEIRIMAQFMKESVDTA
ncbi:MAG: restriction endonuclease [Armatimonadota bacterium]